MFRLHFLNSRYKYFLAIMEKSFSSTVPATLWYHKDSASWWYYFRDRTASWSRLTCQVWGKTFPHLFIMNIFKHTERLEELHSDHQVSTMATCSIYKFPHTFIWTHTCICIYWEIWFLFVCLFLFFYLKKISCTYHDISFYVILIYLLKIEIVF